MEKFKTDGYWSNSTRILRINGNGFNALEIGNERIEVEKFVEFLNKLIENYNKTTCANEDKRNGGTTNPTISGLLAKRDVLEQALRCQINIFEVETKTFIENIEIKRDLFAGEKDQKVTDINFKTVI